LIIKGIYGREMYETWYKMTAMLQSGLDIRPVITHRLKIDDYITGFEAMKSGQCGKVIHGLGINRPAAGQPMASVLAS
jgi:threonine 3-dehydrogenase